MFEQPTRRLLNSAKAGDPEKLWRPPGSKARQFLKDLVRTWCSLVQIQGTPVMLGSRWEDLKVPRSTRQEHSGTTEARLPVVIFFFFETLLRSQGCSAVAFSAWNSPAGRRDTRSPPHARPEFLNSPSPTSASQRSNSDRHDSSAAHRSTTFSQLHRPSGKCAWHLKPHPGLHGHSCLSFGRRSLQPRARHCTPARTNRVSTKNTLSGPIRPPRSEPERSVSKTRP